MKRILFFSLCLMAAMLSFAHDFESGGIYYNITSSTAPYTVAVTYQGTSYSEYKNEYTGSVTIPEKVTYNGKTYSVTSIGSCAFYNCSGLKSVTIPNSVTNIGGSAFYKCSGLTSITIPNSVMSIGGNTFEGTAWYDNLPNGLVYAGKVAYKYKGTMPDNTAIVLEEGTTGIAGNAFYNCSGLTSITIPNSVTSIGYYAFSGCSGLTSVTIGNSVTSIGDDAFYGCSGLKSVTIPNSVTSISNYAFYGCSGLKSVTIGNSVTAIGYNAFYGCSGLTSVTIPNSVTSIGEDAFRDCSGLKKVIVPDIAAWCNISFGNYYANPLYNAVHIYSDENTEITDLEIPNSVTSIGNYAFYNCRSLTSVNIPNSVTSIGSYAFWNCRGLASVTIGNSVTSIGGSAFSSCSGLTSVTIPNGVTSIGDGAFSDCSGLTSVTIPNGVTSIGDGAFSYCSSLTSVTIPNSVTSIGDYAFRDCSGLTKVIVPDIAAWCNISFGNGANPLFYANHIFCDENTEITDLVIPNSVTSIGNSAFYGCSGLTSVTIPNSVTSIGSWAFFECRGLTSIIIPNSVTSIGGSAFNGCSGLTSVTIPNSVTSIGNNAFYKCSGLTSVTINSNSIISNTSSESNLKNIFGSQVKSYIIGNGVTSIGSYAFYNCSGLKSVTIPNSVTSIGYGAFNGCSGLTSVTIPNSVTSIGYQAFLGCSGISSFILPDNITSIGSLAFENTKIYVNTGTKTLLALWNAYNDDYDYYTYIDVYNKETEQKISRPTLSASATQTTLKVFINEMLDCYEYSCDGKIMTDNVVFDAKGLRPGGKENIWVNISLGDFSCSFVQSFSTKGLNPVVKGAASASSINATGSYDTGDAKVIKHELSCNGKNVEGTKISLSGLNPNTSYKVIYTITAAYGENNKDTWSYTGEGEIKTSELKMTTEQPKVVSVGNVIVSAKANVDDAETNVGFEWRRTDWTDDFKSNTGTAYMYEGTMEGYIRNLNAEKLWKFRPYYLADDGTYYYGDWMGLDPTNTSYFEPTVHTYANINIEGNTALVKGYALGGTEKITVQGFKYWKAANLAPSGDLALEARKASPAIPADAQTIEAEGRVMEATLSGLDYECTYSYVAFAKTDEGTFYGEVKTFTTGPNTTGIEVVRDADSETKAVDDKVKGIYTLTGVKVSDDAADLKMLKRGIYIVNGRKVAVK